MIKLTESSEIQYYEEICNYLKAEMEDRLSSLGEFVVDFLPCGRSDLSSRLNKILKEHSLKDTSLKTKVELTRGLYVDILGIVYSKTTSRNQLIIGEVKKHDLTLTDHAQLIGYCIASDVQYGLLIGVGRRVTGGFELLLKQNPSLLEIDRKHIVHKFGICMWRPKTKELFFDPIGAFRSIQMLCRHIASSIEKLV